MLSAAFIGQGVESLLNPKPAAEAAQPTVSGLRTLPDPIGSSIPSNAETFAQINAAVQIGVACCWPPADCPASPPRRWR
ncbi:hypothetical protein NIIDMKKI_31430 [Mycobacterium kansasii]|uniref:Uncharacterized protein n=1 Tax=Mycobacterium kansasii TaxID=1768 RepID=A0A7G1IAH2_MYCKA|nr:hypothetical protein NIIDMKKI_31430 [Mycobacterium kansasii]